MKRLSLPLAALFLPLAAGCGSSSASAAPTSFSFSLPRAAQTSAGAYSSDGTLLRTLWSGRSLGAGAHRETWDGKDESGAEVPAGSVSIRVVASNIKAMWRGVIGNTSNIGSKSSASQTGPGIHKSFIFLRSMAASGNTMYYATGYNEGQPCGHRFSLDAIQTQTPILPRDPFSAFNFVATDGRLVYWANAGGGFGGEKRTFVVATRAGSDAPAPFPSGQNTCSAPGGDSCPPDQRWSGAIDILTGAREGAGGIQVSGLAVQKRGRFLFVAHGERGVINVFDKTSGQFLRAQSIARPRSLCIGADDSLWTIEGEGAKGASAVRNYTVGADGMLSPHLAVSQLVEPLSLAVSPDGKTLVVVQGGARQQVQGFDTQSGALRWTLGQGGGYTRTPDVAPDRFEFESPSQSNAPGAFAAYQGDGSLWIGDGGLFRALRFDPKRRPRDTIQYRPAAYSATVDMANPTRVFSVFDEFAVDYSKLGTPAAWRHVKHWGTPLAAAYFGYPSSFPTGFTQVITLSNGRTYASAKNRDELGGIRQLLELPRNGPVRETPISIYQNDSIQPDGSLVSYKRDDTAHRISWTRRKLTGFDTGQNPVWGEPIPLASAPATTQDPAFRQNSMGRFNAPLMNNQIVSFDQSNNPGFHLGAVRLGESNWRWRASPSTSKDYKGPFPDDGRYDIGNGVTYAGNVALALDRTIIYGYHGEFWKNGQAGKWLLWRDNGLYLGQFGTLGTEHQAGVQGFAGNAWSSTLVRQGRSLYLWVNDESAYAGVHCWQLDGINDVLDLSGSGAQGGDIALAQEHK